MLAVRIIPTVLNRRGQMMKGKAFASDRVIGHSFQASKVFGMRGVDELILLDIGGREPDYQNIRELSSGFFSPLTVGGGIKTSEQVQKLLRSGADKISICTSALEKFGFISELSQKFGSQCVTVSIDVKDNKVYSRNGTKAWDIDPVAWAKIVAKRGAGEILLSSISRDGKIEGYDLELIKVVSQAVPVPVIASGGCSGYEDMYQAVQMGASAVAAGALWSFTDCTPIKAAEYLARKNIEVRYG